MAERFLYIASWSVCALFGLALARRLQSGRPAVRGLAAALTVLVLGGGAWASVERSRDWVDPVRLFGREVERSPRSEKAHLNLAAALWEKGRASGNAEQVAASDRALLAGMALKGTAVRSLTSDHVHLLLAYANHLMERGRAADAVPVYRRLVDTLEQNPGMGVDFGADQHIRLGAALEAAGQPQEALLQYQKARTLKPQWGVPLRNQAQLLQRLGRREEAAEHFRELGRLEPRNAMAVFNLGVTLAELDRRAEAEDALTRLTTLVSASAEDQYVLGLLSEKLGHSQEARQAFQRALHRQPGHAGAKAHLVTLGQPAAP